MQDFCLIQENDSTFDMVIDEDTNDFKNTDSFTTAFAFQMFTEQRVGQEERANVLDRRGWIGDMQTKEERYESGSLLHLQEQSRDTVSDNLETAAYAEFALSYFVFIGASKVVEANIVGENIDATIINRANDIGRYSGLWRGKILCPPADEVTIIRSLQTRITSDLIVNITTDDLINKVYTKVEL